MGIIVQLLIAEHIVKRERICSFYNFGTLTEQRINIAVTKTFIKAEKLVLISSQSSLGFQVLC